MRGVDAIWGQARLDRALVLGTVRVVDHMPSGGNEVLVGAVLELGLGKGEHG